PGAHGQKQSAQLSGILFIAEKMLAISSVEQQKIVPVRDGEAWRVVAHWRSRIHRRAAECSGHTDRCGSNCVDLQMNELSFDSEMTKKIMTGPAAVIKRALKRSSLIRNIGKSELIGRPVM